MLKPLHKNVILKKEEVKESTTASGIILSNTTKNTPSYARVIAIGEKCKADIEVNDQVVFKEYAGTTVKIDDEEFIIVEDEDILAVLA